MSKDFLSGMLRGGMIGLGAIAVIVPITIVLIIPAVRNIAAWVSAPTYRVSRAIPELNATVEFNLYNSSPIGKAEYTRDFVIRTPKGELRHGLFEDWGGAYHFNLYRAGISHIAITGPIGYVYYISLDPLKVVELIPADVNDAEWHYIGAFTRGFGRNFTYEFFGADTVKECIALMGMVPAEVGHSIRKQAFRQSC